MRDTNTYPNTYWYSTKNFSYFAKRRTGQWCPKSWTPRLSFLTFVWRNVETRMGFYMGSLRSQRMRPVVRSDISANEVSHYYFLPPLIFPIKLFPISIHFGLFWNIPVLFYLFSLFIFSPPLVLEMAFVLTQNANDNETSIVTYCWSLAIKSWLQSIGCLYFWRIITRPKCISNYKLK